MSKFDTPNPGYKDFRGSRKMRKSIAIIIIVLLYAGLIIFVSSKFFFSSEAESAESSYESVETKMSIAESKNENTERQQENNDVSAIVSTTSTTSQAIDVEVETVDIIAPADAVLFEGHYYKAFDISLSWTEAEEYCVGLGGHLVSINSRGEQNFIEELSSSSSKSNIWIGGLIKNDVWTWSDGSEFSYTNWDKYIGDDDIEYYKPDNYWGNEYYIRYANDDLIFETWSADKGKWDDTANEADGSGGDAPLSSFGFVCEWQ